MHTQTSQSEEDYLKAIYELTRDTEQASTNAIAEFMDVTPASATGMVQKLASEQPPLLHYEKHHGTSLTSEGELIALEVIRHHRLLETFLYDKLGYTWDEVHDEADRLEHVISEQLEERISHALGDPRFDPHGDPIPDREFQLPEQSSTRLSELRPGEHAFVVRIGTEDPDLLRFLASISLSIRSRITVVDVNPIDRNISLIIDGLDSVNVLGSQVTEQVLVKLVPYLSPHQ